MGVWLSLSTKPIKKILANFALHILWKTKLSARLAGAPAEDTPLLADSPRSISKSIQDERNTKVLTKIFKKAGGVRELIQEICFNKDLSSGYRALLSIFTLIVSCVAVGLIIGGVYAARIRATGPTILQSEKCGLWLYDRNSGGDEATRAGLHDLEKETRADNYAQNCYGTPEMFDAVQCNLLYRKRLPFSQAKYTKDCPFQNEICGQNLTVTFSTDFVKASELGINTPKPPKFRRSTSCTPLSMEFPFIQDQTTNGTTTYYYYYGEKGPRNERKNYTYMTTGDPFDRLAPAYDVLLVVTSHLHSFYANQKSQRVHNKYDR